MTRLPGRELGIKKKFVVGENADASGRRSGDGEIECSIGGRLLRRWRRSRTSLGLSLHGQGSRSQFFFCAISTEAMPCVIHSKNESQQQKKHNANSRKRKPFRRRGDTLLGFGRRRGRVFRASRVIFTEERFFVQS